MNPSNLKPSFASMMYFNLLIALFTTFLNTDAHAMKKSECARPAVTLPSSDPALVGMWSLSATVSPNLKGLDENTITKHKMSFQLNDGTNIDALFFQHPTDDSKIPPLIIANFGLFSDASSSSISLFVKSLILSEKLNADVLIIESNTSANFFLRNHDIGMGGYDEGKILVEVASQFQASAPNGQKIYLFGVSLGGDAVLHALLEDKRLQTNRFSGALIMSSVVDEVASSSMLMKLFGRPLDIGGNSHIGSTGELILRSLFSQFNKEVFSTDPINQPNSYPGSVGDFFYDKFSKRLQMMASATAWDNSVSRTSVEEYLKTSAKLISESGSLDVPVIAIHAKNDPVIPFSDFQNLRMRLSALM